MSFKVILLSMIIAAGPQQSVLDALRQNTSGGCIQVDYEFSSSVSGVKATGEGTVSIQGNSYHMKGNGVEIYCDGTSTWLIDEPAQEVTIESADSKDAGYLANPVILLMNLEKSATAYKVDGNSIELKLSNGTVLEIEITGLVQMEARKPEAFRPPAEFGADWIVTDLRQFP